MTPEPARVCCVYFRGSDGRLAGHVTAGRTVFEAARTALTWFNDDFWKGPKPTHETVFEISVVSRPETWHVRVARLLEKPS